MEILEHLNLGFFLVMTLLYSYQLLYWVIPFFKKCAKPASDVSMSTYGIVIAARNEEQVIGELIQSVWNQDYPKELIQIFVVADNCTDQTAAVARSLGATVYERHNLEQVGKGYALNELFQRLNTKSVDAYVIFDADNLLDEHYLTEMNKTYSEGHSVITSYRNSKNYGTNWISAGQSLWFLKESQYLNRSRTLLGSGCHVSGTGFLVSAKLIQEQGGWPYHTLVEDIEFTVNQAIKGNKIAYCEKAAFYDEQPTTFSQSWHQRLRWSKGFYQVFGKYGWDLWVSMFKNRSFYAFDIFLKILPVGFISGLLLLLNLLAVVFFGTEAMQLLVSGLLRTYLFFSLSGLLTLRTEWEKIYATPVEKVQSLLTFPLFVLTFLPISLVAAFKTVEWKEIVHSDVKSLEMVRKKA